MMNNTQAIRYILDSLQVFDPVVRNRIMNGEMGTVRVPNGRLYTYEEIRRKAEQFKFLSSSHS